MTDPALSTALASALEKGINSALNYDPGTRAKLRRLSHSVIQFECRAPTLHLFFEVDDSTHQLRVASYSEKNVTTKVSSTSLDFLVFFISSDLSDVNSLANSGISVHGNSAKLASLQTLIQELDIDWEQALADLSSPLGEGANVINHQLASTLKAFYAWLHRSKEKFRHNIGDYLREELRAIPSNAELDVFYANVSNLRADTERLHARIELFSQKISTNRD